MRLPQDLANLLAVAIRDVVWYKDSVCGLLEECGVSRSIMLEVRREMRRTPTVKLIGHVLDGLDRQGADGTEVIRKLLTRMYYWGDLHTVPADRRDAAVSSLKAIQEGYRRYRAQSQYEQEQRERRMQVERVERTRLSELDHARLESFRDEFDGTFRVTNPQERGNRFQDLMNRIFDYYCEKSEGPFTRRGEQIDGLFSFDKHWYYVEVRWREDKANAADVSVLRDRAKGAFGGDTKALFISFNGFTEDCLESLRGTRDERVVLMDGFDLRCVLDCQVSLDILLAEKQVELVRNLRPFVSAREVIERRLERKQREGGT